MCVRLERGDVLKSPEGMETFSANKRKERGKEEGKEASPLSAVEGPPFCSCQGYVVVNYNSLVLSHLDVGMLDQVHDRDGAQFGATGGQASSA